MATKLKGQLQGPNEKPSTGPSKDWVLLAALGSMVFTRLQSALLCLLATFTRPFFVVTWAKKEPFSSHCSKHP